MVCRAKWTRSIGRFLTVLELSPPGIEKATIFLSLDNMETRFRANSGKMIFTGYANGVDKRLIAKNPKNGPFGA
jgi:hypothetical protein